MTDGRLTGLRTMSGMAAETEPIGFDSSSAAEGLSCDRAAGRQAKGVPMRQPQEDGGTLALEH